MIEAGYFDRFPCPDGIDCVSVRLSCRNRGKILFFLVILHKRRNKTVLSLNPKFYTVGDGIAVRTIMTGFPAGLNILLLNGCDFIRNGLLGSYGGQLELASWGVVQKIGNAFTQICVGIGQGVRYYRLGRIGTAELHLSGNGHMADFYGEHCY